MYQVSVKTRRVNTLRYKLWTRYIPIGICMDIPGMYLVDTLHAIYHWARNLILLFDVADPCMKMAMLVLSHFNLKNLVGPCREAGHG